MGAKSAAGVCTVAISLAVFGNAADAKPNAIGQWCRLDDPGAIEQERKAKNLRLDQLDRISCREIEPATELPKTLVLPMPCGRRIVFRRLDVPAGHLLDAKSVNLGQPIEDVHLNDRNRRNHLIRGPRTLPLSGSFTLGGQAGLSAESMVRVIYISAYELTEPQHAVWKAGLLGLRTDDAAKLESQCRKQQDAAASVKGTRVLPAVGLSWFDAVAFARDYTNWLISEDARRLRRQESSILPWEGAAPGYLRLPTETEWEFAARGGEVSAAARARRFYSVREESGALRPGNLREVAVVVSPRARPPTKSGAGYMGRRAPNLFGLYDMVGNADEIVFGLFRPIQPNGTGGQSGGYIVRGGNARQPARDLGVFTREEVPFFTARGETRRSLTGMRLVLSAPFFMNRRNEKYEELGGNPELEKAISHALKTLGDTATVTDHAERREMEKTIEELRQQLANGDLETPNLSTSLEGLRTLLMKSTVALNQREQELTEQMVSQAVSLALGANMSGRMIMSTVIQAESQLATIKDERLEDVCRKQTKNLLRIIGGAERGEGILDQQFTNYANTIITLADQPSSRTSGSIRRVSDSHTRLRLKGSLGDIPRIVEKHLEQARKTSGKVSDADITYWRMNIDYRVNDRRRRLAEIKQAARVDELRRGENTLCRQ
tara:strand:+ start:18650 stop:20638 length:1989 start_codon:yes stop_codon:yes gene_type:complete